MNPVHVILVDDDPAVLRLSATVLQRAGFVVDVATTALEILSLMREHEPNAHVLVTEASMGSVDGVELAKEARKKEPSLPVVFITEALEARRLPDPAVRKPFKPKALVTAVRSTLSASRKPAAVEASPHVAEVKRSA